MVDKNNKKEKYFLYFGIAGLLITIFGAISFFLNLVLPSVVASTPNFEGILGTIPLTYPWLNLHLGVLFVTFPWFNYVTVAGLVLLVIGIFARLLGVAKKNHIVNLLLAAVLLCGLMTLWGIQVQSYQSGGTPPPNNLYPTPTPYWTPPMSTPTPYPTTDPNAFSITQRVTEEYAPYYDAPTSYGAYSHIQPVIVDDGYGYTHAISIWGTYTDWSFDVYVQIGSDAAFWYYADSGVTDASGNGYAYVPFYAADAGQVHNVVAVINPVGGSPISYGGFTAGELQSLVADGSLRESNHLSFTVVASAVL